MTPAGRALTPCYIGRTTKPTKHHPEIGTVVCASVDDAGQIEFNAKEIAKWLRSGLTVERVPVWWVRLHLETTATYREGDQPPNVEVPA